MIRYVRMLPGLLLLAAMFVAITTNALGIPIDLEAWGGLFILGILLFAEGISLIIFAPQEAKDYKEMTESVSKWFPVTFFSWANPLFVVTSGCFCCGIGCLLAIIGLFRRLSH